MNFPINYLNVAPSFNILSGAEMLWMLRSRVSLLHRYNFFYEIQAGKITIAFGEWATRAARCLRITATECKARLKNKSWEVGPVLSNVLGCIYCVYSIDFLKLRSNNRTFASAFGLFKGKLAEWCSFDGCYGYCKYTTDYLCRSTPSLATSSTTRCRKQTPSISKTKKVSSVRLGNSQKAFARYPKSSHSSPIHLAETYSAVPDVQKHLLRLLRPADDVGEAGGFLRRHAVVREPALERCALHTCNERTSCLQELPK